MGQVIAAEPHGVSKEIYNSNQAGARGKFDAVRFAVPPVIKCMSRGKQS